MSEDKKKVSFLEKEMTRRQFMKVSGKSLAGLALSGTLLSLFGCTQEQVDQGQVTTWVMPQGLLVVNGARCVGCQRCETNCTLVNEGVTSSHLSRVKITRNLNLNGVHGLYGRDWVYYPDTCRQCKEPACGNACPQQAIYSDENGVKKVDDRKCIGCGACVSACPWQMPTINPETNKSSKCIACGACVAGCPSGALSIVSWDDITANAQPLYQN